MLLRPEYSAQAMGFAPNPMVPRAIGAARELYPQARKVADHGCGKLRHLHLLTEEYSQVVLVDTPLQLQRSLVLDGRTCAIPEYVDGLPTSRGRTVQVMTSENFAVSELGLDVVFSVSVFDVVPRVTRIQLVVAAHRNLSRDGLYIVIAPRNDSSILRRCTDENRFDDGHYFLHHGAATFYRNYRDHGPLVRLVVKRGFKLVRDVSVYRQVCLVFGKT